MTKEEIQALIASEIKENLKFEIEIKPDFDKDGWPDIRVLEISYNGVFLKEIELD